jgi:hypothetical protein
MNDALALFVPAAGAVVAAFILYRFFRRKDVARTVAKPDPTILTTTADDRGFTVTDSRKIKSLDVRWQDVKEVRIIRTDTGPFDDTVFYHVTYEGGEITIPANANNMQAFTDHLAVQTGFDRPVHDAALSSTANNTYSRIFTA